MVEDMYRRTSWGEDVYMQQVHMEVLNPERYKQFVADEVKCHSYNLQASIDLMKESNLRERAKMETFNKKNVKEYNKAVDYRGTSPISWDKAWNYKDK